jgi:hypothetical protein
MDLTIQRLAIRPDLVRHNNRRSLHNLLSPMVAIKITKDQVLLQARPI